MDEAFAWQVVIGTSIALFFGLVVFSVTSPLWALVASLSFLFVGVVFLCHATGRPESPVPLVVLVVMVATGVLAGYVHAAIHHQEKTYYFTPHVEGPGNETNQSLPSCIIEYYPLGCENDTLRIYVLATGTSPVTLINITHEGSLVYETRETIDPLRDTVLLLDGCPSLIENQSRIYYCCDTECHYWNYSSRGWPPS